MSDCDCGTSASFPIVDGPMQNPTSLSLLAPNGIVHVTFGVALNADQSLALLEATQRRRPLMSLDKHSKNWASPGASDPWAFFVFWLI